MSDDAKLASIEKIIDAEISAAVGPITVDIELLAHDTRNMRSGMAGLVQLIEKLITMTEEDRRERHAMRAEMHTLGNRSGLHNFAVFAAFGMASSAALLFLLLLWFPGRFGAMLSALGAGL